MTIIRKFQVFISSTYEDLIDERQAAVSAILAAGHIPAGMELFTAGDVSQMTTIRKWIAESDLFLLILGARYGSIEPTTQNSYIELEYDFALEKGLPFFALVPRDAYIEKKVKRKGSSPLEADNPAKLKTFREKELSRLSSFYDDLKDIEIGIHRSIAALSSEHELSGWVRAENALGFEKWQRLEDENHNWLQRWAQVNSELSAAQRQLQLLRETLPVPALSILRELADKLEQDAVDLSSDEARHAAFSELLAAAAPPSKEGNPDYYKDSRMYGTH